MTNTPGSYMSFLDLTCCSFGCALLLLLLVAAANPETPQTSPKNSVMVIHYYQENIAGAKPEIRIEFQRPGRTDWERIEKRVTPGVNAVATNTVTDEPFEFSAPALNASGGESIAVFFDPTDGFWSFRAFVVGFPKGQVVGPVLLKFNADGEGINLQGVAEGPKPVWPGDFTPKVDVFVSKDS